MAEAPILCVAAAVLLLALAGCAEDNPKSNGDSDSDNQLTSPCEDGSVQDLGVPNPFDRYAAFEVVEGPVWVAVKDWQTTGVIDPRGQRGFLKVGPLDQPPVADQNGHIASQSDQVEVEESLWSRFDLEPGSYWLLGPGNAGHISIQTCGDATVQDVAPAE